MDVRDQMIADALRRMVETYPDADEFVLDIIHAMQDDPRFEYREFVDRVFGGVTV